MCVYSIPLPGALCWLVVKFNQLSITLFIENKSNLYCQHYSMMTLLDFLYYR
jgi:hypothetical protein